jgi:aspartate ammonia-lyase
MKQAEKQFRLERDPVGEVKVPADALYGVQTKRALDNFQISRLRIHPALFTAYAEIKKAAAHANVAVGKLDAEVGDAIQRAADEVIAGRWADQFQLDVFQAGAGTSYNMNVNEVIANRALELLGEQRGDYRRLHPNDHVNKAQSTNDTMPTAMRIAAARLMRETVAALDSLAAAFADKAAEFAEIRKSGRTHLHDATEMTLGQEFGGYANNLKRAAARVRAAEDGLLEVPLGGTAIGSGLNAHPDFARLAVEKLGEITGLKLREAADRFQSQQSLGDFLALSAALRGFVVELTKITNDLRLLDSGPHTGLYEIELPAVQPGSSIMPGKVNPAVPEMMNMVCFHVIGHDAAITHCAEAGQLELNVMMPYVAYALFESLEVLRNAARTFEEKCVRLIKAHPDRCREYAERSVGRAASLNEQLGFMGAAEVAIQAIESGKSVQEITGQKPPPD